MLYLANPSTAPIRAAMTRGHIGAIMSHAQANRLPPDVLFAIDNNCGPGRDGQPGTSYPGDSTYYAYIDFLAAADITYGADTCDPDTSCFLFATCPDVLGDAAATLRRAERILPVIRHVCNAPVAFVAQNGQEYLPVPWDEFNVLFLGGVPECVPCRYTRPPAGRDRVTCPRCRRRLTEWKLGTAARLLTAEAARQGKRVHMGRVNSLRRLEYAWRIGCDTADGTYLTRAPDKLLPDLLRWDRAILNLAAHRQHPLGDSLSWFADSSIMRRPAWPGQLDELAAKTGLAGVPRQWRTGTCARCGSQWCTLTPSPADPAELWCTGCEHGNPPQPRDAGRQPAATTRPRPAQGRLF